MFNPKTYDLPWKILKFFLKHLLKRKDSWFLSNSITDISLTDDELSRLLDWHERYHQKEPLSKIVGYREFFSLPFYINEHVLDPRAESETLVECVLMHFDQKKSSKGFLIIDLGTGSGCLLLSLLHHSNLMNLQSQGIGIDISLEALKIAELNAESLNLLNQIQFIHASWGEGLNKEFLLNAKGKGMQIIVISNPPYIGLNEEICDITKKYDPSIALFSGVSGLECYKKILKDLQDLQQVPWNHSFFEVGFTQSSSVQDLIKTYGFNVTKVTKDLLGIERVIEFTSC